MDRAGGDVPERLAIARLDTAASDFAAASRHLEALDCMEKALAVRVKLFGVRSAEVWAAAKDAGELCNLLALSYLQKEDYAVATSLLKRAELLTERDAGGRAITYNNWACLMRQQGKLRVALSHLQRALALETRLGKAVNNPADTHLNLCAVLSQLHRHAEALEHAQAALDLVSAEIFGDLASATGGAASAMATAQGAKPDRVAVLCIAYHNLGVENEIAKKVTPALKAYTKGVEIAGVYLGAAHGITATLRTSQLGAARAIEDAKKREAAKLAERQQKIEAAAIAKAKSGMVKPGR